ncbi:MAG: succinate-semialdehyde dehydrogenase [marine bacterium B5-7]|nr:MAG: succinate-semialdehyde dehydrogenase [marine bacterium B5-7]
MTIQTTNPATGASIKTYRGMNDKNIDDAVAEVHGAFLQWRETDFATRRHHMQRVVDALVKQKEDFARLITQEMGKPITQSRAEIDKCVNLCEHYMQHAETYLASRHVDTQYSKSYVTYEPMGIVFAIMPWNFPFWQVFRFIVPTLMAGNVGILSHAEISTGTGFAIETIFEHAGFPHHAFRHVAIENAQAAKIIADERVTAVTLTGSEGAGRAVAAQAGQALKPIVLELGGCDAYVILEDADLDLAAEACVKSRLNNSGQVCIAAKRMIVVDAVREEFQRLVIEKAQAYVPGDPMDEACTMGPMARADLREGLHKQVLASVEAGATLVQGGEIPEHRGFYYPVTILKDIPPEAPAYYDELFGPVVAFIDAKDEEEALTIANSVHLGLGAAVFTQDLEKGEHIAKHVLQAGAVFVNAYVGSDPRLPFGGVYNSGFGRELSEEGIRAFVNTKTVCVK